MALIPAERALRSARNALAELSLMPFPRPEHVEHARGAFIFAVVCLEQALGIESGQTLPPR